MARHIIPFVSTLTALALGACAHDAPPARSDTTAAVGQVADATDAEVQVSIAGEPPPGRRTYAYRGLYAGMPRTELETHVKHDQPSDVSCGAGSGRDSALVMCHYQLQPASPGETVTLDVTYPGASTDAASRIVIATRQLPLDVDGVRLAQMMADAFEKQTVLLDTRDATYGKHSAHVRVGTTGGTHQNFADLIIEPKGGREVLTVKLSRAEAPVTAKPKS